MSLAALSVWRWRRSLAGGTRISGEYVEARTAEVFTGGCIMGSEAETIGKQAVLAWKVDRGSFNGVSLDGLSVVAAVAGDRNLGIAEIGGDKAERALGGVRRRSAPIRAQQLALVAMASELSKGTVAQHRPGDAGADSVRRSGHRSSTSPPNRWRSTSTST